MFSSNQHFDITCSFEELPRVIDFAVHLAGDYEMFTRQVNRVKVAWQETSTGLYCIGPGTMAAGGIHPHRSATSEGWSDYPFDYDSSIIAGIITQWIEKQPTPDMPDTDGSTELGVRVRDLNTLTEDTSVYDCGIKTPYALFLAFEPFVQTYDK